MLVLEVAKVRQTDESNLGLTQWQRGSRKDIPDGMGGEGNLKAQETVAHHGLS